MTVSRRTLLVVASPKAHHSVSHSLASHLAGELSARQGTAHLAYVSSPKRSAPSIVHLHRQMDESDLLVFVFPLYLDQPPAALVKALEDYAWHRRNRPFHKSQSLVAVANSRLPGSRHGDTALAVLKRFADLEGLQWLGGLAVGGSRVLQAGKPLSASGLAGRHAVKALKKAAEALAQGLPVPSAAVRLLRQPPLPERLYVWAVNRFFRAKARKAGTLHRLKDTPYDFSANSPAGT